MARRRTPPPPAPPDGTPLAPGDESASAGARDPLAGAAAPGAPASETEAHRRATEAIASKRDEIHHANDALATLNRELKRRVEEVSRMHVELERLLAATGVAVLALDAELRVARFTPHVADVLPVSEEDLGRPLAHLTQRLSYPGLADDAARVLRTLVPTEREVATAGGTRYLIRLHPHRTQDGRVEGVALTLVDLTAIKKAEETIRIDAERFAALVHHTAAAVAECAFSGAFTFVNERYGALTGYPSEELLAMRMQDLVHPDDRARYEALFERLASDGAPFEVEQRCVRKDGTVVWVQSSVSVVRDAGGQPRSAVSVAHDVTAEVVARNHERFRAALVDALRPLTDPAAIQAEAARVVGEHLGVSRVAYGEIDEAQAHVVVARDHTDGVVSVVGRHRLDDFGPRLIADLKAGRTVTVADVGLDPRTSGPGAAAFAAIETRSLVCVPLVKEGRFAALFVLHHAAPRAWQPEEVALVEETAERTWAAVEQTRAEAARARLQSLFDVTLSNISDFAYAFDRDGRFVFVNQPLLDLWGRTLDEAIGKNFYDLAYPDDLADRLQRQIQEVFDTGRGLTDETPYVSPTGQDGYYEYIFSPVVGDGGTVTLVAGSTRDITERKRTEAALRASEQRYRTLFESIDEGFALCEMVRDEDDRLTDCRYLEVNPAFEKMTGLAAADVVGRRARELFPGIEEAWIETYRRVVETGEPVRFEQHIAALGQWYEVYAFPQGDDAFAGIFTNVTERKAADAALRESEARFRQLADAVPQLVWTTDADGRTTHFNARWLAYTGQTAADALAPEGPLDVIHPDDAARVAEQWAAVRDNGDTLACEYRLRRHDGLYAWHFAQAVPVRSDDGAIVQWVGSATNIEPLREAEAARRASEARYRLLVESATEYAILALDADGVITAWNAGAERVCGYTAAEAVGQPCALIFTEEDRAAGADEHELETARREGRAADERWHRRKDGSRFWGSGVLNAVRDGGSGDGAGGPSGFVKVFRDVTAQREAAEALRQSEERYRTFLGLSVEGIWRFDLDEPIPTGLPVEEQVERMFAHGWLAECNEAMARMYGYARPEELIGARLGAFLDPADPHNQAYLHAFAASGYRLDGAESREADRDGRPLVFSNSLTGQVEASDAGEVVVRAWGTQRDVTAQRAAEEALRASEGRLRAALDAAQMGTWSWDADAGEGHLDARAARILALAPGEPFTFETAFVERTHPDDQADVRARVFAAAAPGSDGRVHSEHRFVHPDGTVCWIRMDGEVARESDGGELRVVGIAGTVFDVTARREAEEQLRQSEARLRAFNEQLETRVAERTIELAQKTEDARALTAALTLAEQRERHRIAEVLHDHVQQLLYAAQIRLHLIPTVAPAALPEQAAAMRALLDEALQTTRTLTVDLSPPVLRDEGLADALRWLAAQMEETHGLHVEVEAEGDVTPPEDRRILLFQLVRELLFNVAKHAGTGQARVCVREAPHPGKRRGRKGRTLEVTVEDEGAGFDAQAVRARVGESGGFGLFSVKERLDLLGGSMAVASTPGKGTRVVIRLPM